METFSVFVAPEIEDEKIDLIRAALVIARTEYPNLDIEVYAARMEELARRVAALVPIPIRNARWRPSTRCCLRN